MSQMLRPKTSTVLSTVLPTAVLAATFSTLLIVFSSHQIGRDVELSFMDLGTILLGDSGVVTEPTWREIAAGLAFHMFADISWAVLFFGVGARLTWQLRPVELLLAAPFWALATEAAEYHVFLPWLQPLVLIQTPFWIGLTVHLASGAAYPLFYWIRKRFVGPGAAEHVGFGRGMALVLAGILVLAIGSAALHQLRREPYLPLFGGPQAKSFDQSFFRMMSAHHQVGVELSQLAADRAVSKDVQVLGRLMVAEQQAEIEAQQRWWQSWFGGVLPPPSPEEHAMMPGMLPSGALEQLATLSGSDFDQRFLDLMIRHHEGAVQMSDQAWSRAGDLRLRIFAIQIRHAQTRQITRMMVLRRPQTMHTAGSGSGNRWGRAAGSGWTSRCQDRSRPPLSTSARKARFLAG